GKYASDRARMKAALEAAARVRAENDAFRDAVVTGLGAVKINADGTIERVDLRAEAAAETLIDTVSEEVWNHDASQDNCNVIDKDGLTNTGEPVAYRWRYRNSITNTWSNWIDGR